MNLYVLSLIYICNSFIDGSSKIKKGLPEKCVVACSLAVSCLDEVYDKLKAGAISIIELQKICGGIKQMDFLCESASAGGGQDKPAEERLTCEEIIKTVNQRVEEFEFFESQQGMLLHLCQKIPSEIKGIVHKLTC